MRVRRTTELSETEQAAVELYRQGIPYEDICTETGLSYTSAKGAVKRARNKLARTGVTIPDNPPQYTKRPGSVRVWEPEYLRGITEFCIACKDVAGRNNDGYYCAKDGTQRDWDTPGCKTWVEGST